ncbi:hypothetical protein D3OALGB2SA_1209, partial [Olavius algarvensis associated proteobacterium Delta 3]
ALDRAGINASDLDMIVMATITPDTCCPSGANWPPKGSMYPE